MAGKLYVVGTPIGNLEDITLRALRVLKEADVIAAEDTRRTGLLLQHFNISKPQISLHRFNEARRGSELLERFERGENIALVSDAGMPGISDPGERLIRECLSKGVAVEVIPGPSAVLHALVASGFPAIPFYFGGFLPVKGGGRIKELTAAGERDCTSVYFESPHRLLRTLDACAALWPERLCCVARELTKKFEEVVVGRPAELKERFAKPRGEITFLVSGKS
ncbi:MAG: 16S rRNA (cytidine(1402)-2'-O)-methyltransferase [bacterium]